SKCQVRYEEAENDRIKVTWAMQGRMDTAGGGWLAMLMPRTIGRSFDAGLANLKKLAEAE
ncbi:MAG: polyketide cyclase, partial [Planctomycetota bacterium]